MTLSAPALDVQVRTMDGETWTATLTSLGDGAATLQSAGGPRSLTARQLMQITPMGFVDSSPENPTGKIEIGMRDGSTLFASQLSVTQGRVTLKLAGGGSVRASTRGVQFIRFNEQDARLARQWTSILSSEAPADAIVIRKTSRIADERGGERIASALDQLEGIIGDVSESHVGFQFDDSQLEVPREKVEGLIYHRPRDDRPRAMVCQVVTAAGSRFNARSVGLRDGKVTLVTTGGVRTTLPWDSVRALDYAPANLTYLDELQPERVEWRPHVLAATTPPSVARWFRPRTDQASLTLRGTEYDNGLTLHSRTQLSYRLATDFQRFRATVGIDDRFRSEGNVRLVVSAESKVLFEEEIAGDDDAIELDLPIDGARRLTILVDFGSDGNDWGDHLHLCNARFAK
jgi:hypothetical protein